MKTTRALSLLSFDTLRLLYKSGHYYIALTLLAVFLLGTLRAQDAAVSDAPSLTIPANQTRRLPPARHVFSRVEISEGASLIVDEGSEEIFQIVCLGDFILRGRIVAQGFSSAERIHALGIPHQPTPLEIAYRNTNLGGQGGNGGTGGVNVGGVGAAGTIDYGGGGGGGGGYRPAKPKDIHWKGTNAQGSSGGQAGQYCGNAGGNGAERNPAGNGGVVYLNVAGNFEGEGGSVFAEGLAGSPGSNSGPEVGGGVGSYTPMNGAGGGGGGAPGNHGGSLVVFVGGTIRSYPSITRLKGGAGGEPGKSLGIRLGTPGTKGKPGTSGNAYWYTKEGRVYPQ